jgi:hypothetical protein
MTLNAVYRGDQSAIETSTERSAFWAEALPYSLVALQRDLG